MYLDFFLSFPEATRAGYIILLFLVGLLVVNLMVVGLLFLWKYHQKIKHWSQPPLQIPSHFEEVRGDLGGFSCKRGTRGEHHPKELLLHRDGDKQVLSQNCGFSDCDLPLLSSFAELKGLSCALGHKPGCAFLEKPEPA